MSVHLMELIFFAGVALLIISKLISMLGETNEKDQSRSFYGETDDIKDITPTSKDHNVVKGRFSFGPENDLVKKHAVARNLTEIKEGIIDIERKISVFNLDKFIQNSKAALKMIINAASQNDSKMIEQLIDSRYIDQFNKLSKKYGTVNEEAEIVAKISEAYTFGNNVFLKVYFNVKGFTSNLKTFKEEWTFSKSALSKDPAWYLSNIEKA